MPVRLPVSRRRPALHLRAPKACGRAAILAGFITSAIPAWLAQLPLVLPVPSTVAIAAARLREPDRIFALLEARRRH